MNKVKYLPFIILCMLLSGCGAEKNTISTEAPTETAIQTSEIELKRQRNRSKAVLKMLTENSGRRAALKPI